MDSLDDSYLLTGYEPKNYDLMETCVESFTESLTHPQFSEQGFLEDVDYDDTALEDNTEFMSITPSEKACLSGQSSSSVSERTGRPVGERTFRPSGQELNVGNAQIGTLFFFWTDRKSKFSPSVRQRLRNTNSKLIVTEEVYEN